MRISKRKRARLIAVAVALSVLALMGAIAFAVVVNARFRHALWSQNAAGWAQAVGTVGAVAFAWWQGQRGISQADKRKRDDHLRFLGGLYAQTVKTLAIAEQATRAVAARDHKGMTELALNLRDELRTFERINTLPIQDWPTPFMPSAVDLIIDALRELTTGDLRLLAKLGRHNVNEADVEDFRGRNMVLVARASPLLQQIQFSRAVNEDGPLPTIHFVNPSAEKVGS